MAPNIRGSGLLLFTALSMLECHAKPSDDGLCIPREREALLSFKRDLTDPSNVLSTWVHGSDCCLWHGVVCHNSTGHVLQLRLPPTDPDFYWNLKMVLGGKLNPSLLNLEYLTDLDLSLNYFGGIPVPAFLGSMKNLRYLNLSRGGFSGTIPHQLGNLSGLQYLDLANNYEFADGSNHGLKSESLQWVSGLSSLLHLDLSGADLSAANDWVQVTNTLPNLILLILSGCFPNLITPSPPAVNFSSLSVLDLSFNSFYGYYGMQWSSSSYLIPEWIFGLPGLTLLSLHDCGLEGSIPVGLRNLTCLRYLDLSHNDFNSSIPNWLSDFHDLEVLNLAYLFGPEQPVFNRSYLIDHLTKLKNLTYLDLSGNSLSGPIPESIRNLSSLKDLYLRLNELNGPIPESVGSLKCLRTLDVEANQLNGPIPESIGGMSSLEYFRVGDNKLNGTLPASFGQLVNLVEMSTYGNPMKGVATELHFANLTKLTTLDASGNELSLNVSPKWLPPFQLMLLRLDFWRIGPLFPSWLQSQKSLTTLQMSNVGISSSIPNWFWISFPHCYYYNLSHNQIHGHLKNLPSVMPFNLNQQSAIDLSSNQLGGTLPLFPLDLVGLDISNNLFSGSISNFLCHKPHVFRSLIYLNLRCNHLSGKIPDCWMSWTNLQILNLESNEFVGKVPSSIGYIESLQSLHLRKNHLEGEVPSSLMNCTMLKIVNLEENNLKGNIPSWFGERFALMNILILRSNKFHGQIPNQLCFLRYLQLLDLAHNNLFGTIPRCFNNFTTMITAPNSSLSAHIQLVNSSTIDPITEDAFVVTKGNGWVYTNNLGLMTAIDLSNNNLTGIIPIELTNLAGLRSLNLSNNFLVGQIPHDIGTMRVIESIDVSENEISGQIPLSISHLTSLCWLNLSNNYLVGEIPMGPQLQRLPASGFSGNKLCGSPLPNNCSNSSSSVEFTRQQGKVKNELAVGGVYVSMAIGFIVGFWIVWFPLIFSKSWRWFYFASIDRLWNRIAACY